MSNDIIISIQKSEYKKKILCLRFRTFSLTKINRFCGGWKATKISIQIVLILGYAKYFFATQETIHKSK